MSHNLLLWKWSPDFDTPEKRRRYRLKFDDITSAFAAQAIHPSIGDADLGGFHGALDAAFGRDELARPFTVEIHSQCVVVSYSGADRVQLVPRIAAIGKRYGLNAAEF